MAASGASSRPPTVGAAAPAPAVASASPAAALASTPRYLALGDSFTIGTGSPVARSFPARLVARWREQGCGVELSNVAVNGFSTADVIAEELPAVTAFRPTLVTVAAGANDIVRGRSIDEYRSDVRRILAAAAAGGARVVVLPQPDWSGSPAAAAFGSREALAKEIVLFNAVLAEEARARKLTFVDLWPLMRAQAASGQIASDGLHPSAEAYDAWAAELARALPSPCDGRPAPAR